MWFDISCAGQFESVETVRRCNTIYRAVESAAVLVKDANQDLDRVRILQDLEHGRIHGEMFHSFQHVDEVVGLKQLASSH